MTAGKPPAACYGLQPLQSVCSGLQLVCNWSAKLDLLFFMLHNIQYSHFKNPITVWVRSSVGERLLDAQEAVSPILTEPTTYYRTLSGFFDFKINYFITKDIGF